MIKKYRAIIEQVKKEEHEVILTCDSAMAALDQARQMVSQRNNNSNNNVYSVIKVEEIEE